MPLVQKTWVDDEAISSRVARLQTRYAGNPLVKGIVHRIGVDWADEPAVFIKVAVDQDKVTEAEVQQLAQDILHDLLYLVRTDEIGLHSYLSFAG